MPSGIYLRTDETKLKLKIATCKHYNKPVDDTKRFWSYVTIKGKDECWEWQGIYVDGYGVTQINRKRIYSHRYSYQLYYGEIPKGRQVNHTCHNRKCVNPFHLYAGTQQDNINDRNNANRQFRKLEISQVVKIRENKDNLSQRELGKIFGVTHRTIGCIKRNETWRLI